MRKKYFILPILSGMILPIIFNPWSREVCVSCFCWLWTVLTFFRELLIYRIRIPVWLFIIFLISLISCILHFMLKLRQTRNDFSVKYEHEGITWRADCDYNNCVSNLWAFCPNCGMELVYRVEKSSFLTNRSLLDPDFNSIFTHFWCENPNCTLKLVKKFPGDLGSVINHVQRLFEHDLSRKENKND